MRKADEEEAELEEWDEEGEKEEGEIDGAPGAWIGMPPPLSDGRPQTPAAAAASLRKDGARTVRPLWV